MTFLYRKMYEGASPASLAPLSLLGRMRMRRTESFDLEEAVPASTEAYTTQPVTTAPAGIIQETTAPLDSSLDGPSSPLQGRRNGSCPPWKRNRDPGWNPTRPGVDCWRCAAACSCIFAARAGAGDRRASVSAHPNHWGCGGALSMCLKGERKNKFCSI